MKFLIAPALSLAVVTSSVRADVDLCQFSPDDWDTVVADMLVGVWSVHNGVGVASVAGIPIALPPATVGKMTIAQIGSGLTATGAGGEIETDFSIEFVRDETWTFDELIDSDDAPPYEDLADMATTFGQDCPDILPRIRFSTTIPMQGNSLMITMDLVMMGDDRLYGVGDFFMTTGQGPMVAQRAMVLSK